MGFWLDYNVSKILPFTRKLIWYCIFDEKRNWNFGIAKVKKGQKSFKWRGKDYFTYGSPENISVGKMQEASSILPFAKVLKEPIEYETSLNARIYFYFYDCPYPLNIIFDPSADHLVSFREQSETDQITKANQERRAFIKASQLVKKSDNNMLMLFLGAMALQTIILLYFLFNIINKFPK